jgi:hypothetical protein
MTRWLLLPLALPLLAASPAPRQHFSLTVPSDPLAPLATGPLVSARPATTFQPAPTPNRDAALPTARASDQPRVTPSLFTTPNQYRGDGFSPGSTAQSEQERHMKPGAGFSLHMPFTQQ